MKHHTDRTRRKPQIALFAAVALAACIAPLAHAEDYYVAPAGQKSAGDAEHSFETVQAALDKAPAGTADAPTRILLAAGTYKENLKVPKKAYLALIGTDADATKTVLTFDLAATTPKPGGAGGTVGTTGSASTTVNASHFTAANVSFVNSTPYLGSQAVAVKTNGDAVAFVNCRFVSYQDTLYVTNGRSYFRDCTVSGSVDFIFGNGTSVLERCTINSSHPGCVTAANTPARTAVGLVLKDCTLTAADPGAPKATVQLGRPWQFDRGSYASTIYLDCKVGPHVSPEGWNPWDKKNTNPAGDTRYAYHGLTDAEGKPLDTSKFVKWAHALTDEQAAQLTPAHAFGPADFWQNDDWKVAGKIWGPLNDVGQSGVTQAIAPDTKFQSWGDGDTWDPAAQVAAAAIPVAK